MTKREMAFRIEELERALDKILASHADFLEWHEHNWHSNQPDIGWSREFHEDAKRVRR